MNMKNLKHFAQIKKQYGDGTYKDIYKSEDGKFFLGKADGSVTPCPKWIVEKILDVKEVE